MSASHSRLASAQRFLQQLVASPDPQALLGELERHDQGEGNGDNGALSHRHVDLGGLSAADRAALRQLDPRRLLVYRRLIHGTLRDTFRAQLTRTASRLGNEGIATLVSDFCAQQLPTSQVLRDVVFEMCAWALPRWRETTNIPRYLGDLARFELMEFEVYAAERFPPGWPRNQSDDLQPNNAVAFDGSMRLLWLDCHAHEVPDDPTDRTIPLAEPVALLAYRDHEGSYRQLDLTPLAAAMLERLWRGEPLGAAIAAACEEQQLLLTQLIIDGISAVLADLADRRVVLGATSAGERSPPSPWAFRICRENNFAQVSSGRQASVTQ